MYVSNELNNKDNHVLCCTGNFYTPEARKAILKQCIGVSYDAQDALTGDIMFELYLQEHNNKVRSKLRQIAINPVIIGVFPTDFYGRVLDVIKVGHLRVCGAKVTNLDGIFDLLQAMRYADYALYYDKSELYFLGRNIGGKYPNKLWFREMKNETLVKYGNVIEFVNCLDYTIRDMNFKKQRDAIMETTQSFVPYICEFEKFNWRGN